MKKLAVVSLFALSMGVSVAFSNTALQDSDIAILFSKDIDTSKIALLSQQEMQETKGEFWSFLSHIPTIIKAPISFLLSSTFLNAPAHNSTIYQGTIQGNIITNTGSGMYNFITNRF